MTKFRPDATTVSFWIEGPDIQLRLMLPRWNTRSLYSAPHRNTDIGRIGSLRMDASYSYFAEVHPESVDQLKLSFKAAKQLRDWAEQLPPGPVWKSVPISMPYPSKRPLTLFYRDPLDVLQSILHNPAVAGHIGFTPVQIFPTGEKLYRLYSSWLSGTQAWDMQVCSSPFVSMNYPF